VTGFFTSRWRGAVPPSRLSWRDMLLLGSVINLTASFAALVLATQAAPLGAAAALHFAPLPYNLFLPAALWRHPQRGAGQAATGGVWFAVALVV
jgi:hypothetical protein